MPWGEAMSAAKKIEAGRYNFLGGKDLSLAELANDEAFSYSMRQMQAFMAPKKQASGKVSHTRVIRVAKKR